MWTQGDTWGSNVAGHVSAGPLIREGDSQTGTGRQPSEPPPSENGGVRGSWIEIKPQVLLSLSQQGPRYFYLKTWVFSKSSCSCLTHQNLKICMKKGFHPSSQVTSSGKTEKLEFNIHVNLPIIILLSSRHQLMTLQVLSSETWPPFEPIWPFSSLFAANLHPYNFFYDDLINGIPANVVASV